MIMTCIKPGVIIAVCTSIVMSMVSFGSVKDDLTALEKEAGIETDEDTSISSRLSVLEEAVLVAYQKIKEESVDPERVAVRENDIGYIVFD